MKKKAIFSILILISGLLEVTILDSFKISGVRPNLLLMCAAIAGIIFDLKWAFVFGIFSGILKDSLGAGSFGVNTLLYPLWVYFVIRLSREIPLDSNLVRTVLIFVIVVLHSFLKKFIFFVLGIPSVSIGAFLYITFLESLYTAAILPALFKFIESIYPVTIE